MDDIEKELPGFWAIIPATVRYDKDLIPNAKLLFAEITALQGKDGYIYTKDEYFSRVFNVTKNNITKWIRQLRDKNYIKVQFEYKGKSLIIKKGSRRISVLLGIEKDSHLGIEKDSTINNNKYKSIINNTSVSKETTINDLKKDTPKIKNKILNISNNFREIINIWNSIKLISKHNLDKYSKTLENASKYYTLLQTGKFIEYTNITDDQLTKLNIPIKDKHKKFTHEEIIKGLHNYSLQFEQGYWPCTEADKMKLPRSLSSCFYNKYNQNCVSPFLKVFYNKPKKLNTEKSLPEIKDPGYNILREVLKSMSGSSLDEVRLYGHVKLIREWIAEIREDFKYLPTRSNDAFYSRFTADPKSVNLFRDLEDFIQQRKEGNVIADVNMVKPGTKTWKAFEVYLFKNFGIDVNNPPKKPKEIIKKVYIQELQYPWDREEDDFHPEACMYRNFTEEQKKYFKEKVLVMNCKTQEELEKAIEDVSYPLLKTKDEIEKANRKAKAFGRSDLVRSSVV